jgi:cytoskeletal protein CcmA (bactofilin family)
MPDSLGRCPASTAYAATLTSCHDPGGLAPGEKFHYAYRAASGVAVLAAIEPFGLRKGVAESNQADVWRERGYDMGSKAQVTTPAHSTTRVGTRLHVKGEISGNGDLYVDGSVDGPIELGDGRLTVGPSGKVTADVVAREVIVHGSIKGSLRARNRIEIKKDGSVVGDLLTASILIEDGARFKGSIEIDRRPVDAIPVEETAGAVAATATGHPTPPENS